MNAARGDSRASTPDSSRSYTMTDILIVFAFVGIVLAPCLVALHVGAHNKEEEA